MTNFFPDLPQKSRYSETNLVSPLQNGKNSIFWPFLSSTLIMTKIPPFAIWFMATTHKIVLLKVHQKNKK